MSLSRSEVAKWLREHDIEFSATATVIQLKKLRLSELHRATMASSSNNETNSGRLRQEEEEELRLRQEEEELRVRQEEEELRLRQEEEELRLRQEEAEELRSLRAINLPPISPSIRFGARLPSDTAHEEAELDVQIRIAQKKRQLALLRTELAAELPSMVSQPSFHDIKHSVLLFSGPSEYDANKWLADFERICDSVNGDDFFRLKCIRRLMKPESEAEWFLRTDGSITYAEFRANFLTNFGHRYTLTEILERMRKTLFNPSKQSVMGYILQMQELAARVHLDEVTTVRYIIDGFRDRTPHIAVLYPANTIMQLKQLAHRYEELRNGPSDNRASNYSVNLRQPPSTNVTTHGASVPGTSSRSAPGAVANTRPTYDPNVLRCYNCSGVGHIAARCTEPKRAHGTCFRCGNSGHMIRDCPRPAPSNVNQVALVDEFRGLNTNTTPSEPNPDDVLNTSENVSVTFIIGDCNRLICDTLLSLFDTGSPISLIRCSSIPKQCIEAAIRHKPTDSGYSGLGNFRLCTYGIIQVAIKFRNITKLIKLYIVSDNFIPYPILLGRDFLSVFNIQLSINKITQNRSNEITPKIEYDEKINELRVSNRVLHCVYTSPNLRAIPYKACRLCFKTIKIPIPHCNTAIKYGDTKMMNSEGKCGNEHFISEIAAIDIPTHYCGYDINPDLNAFHRDSLVSLIENNYVEIENIPETSNDYEMKLRLSNDIPISYAPRRLSYADKIESDKMISELLAQGHIRASHSPYAFPIVMVPKKNGERRMCVDFRPLNKITIRDNYPLPLIDDCLERMEGKCYFSLLDLKSGFHQVKMAPDSVSLTAFVTPSGQYEYLRMPFGLRNAPAVFQRFINLVLRPFIDEGSVIVYIDDIAIATRTIPEHFDLLGRLLRRLAEFRLEIKLSKCQFCYTEIDLLGFNISKHGIRPNNGHLEAIHVFPTPKNVADIQKCLGLFTYFRRFVPSFSSIAAPLRNLTKPGVDFVFDEGCKLAFEELRTRLVHSPILALYNPVRETELHCDASALGFGGILMQKQNDNKFHPIAYFSKRATPAESRYHSFELETLAIIYSLRKFRIYLEGIEFRIITDCNSLTLTLNRKSVNARIARWSLELENFHYTIQHRSGQRMGHVDALSRCVPSNDSDLTISVVHPNDINFQIQVTQNRDGNILAIRKALESGPVECYVLDDDLIYRVSKQGNHLLYVPGEMEDSIIRHCHEKICHMGITKCMDQIRMHYWFPKMQVKVEKFIRNCLYCLTYNMAPHANNRTLHHIPKRPIPFDTIHIDHFGPLPAIISKRKHILVVTDSFTKFVKLYACNSTSTKEVCASLDKYIEYFSRPRRIISDKGTCFSSHDFVEYVLGNNIEHIMNASSSPQANGQVERVNRVLKSILAKISEPLQHSDWHKLLIRVEYAINNSVHSVTKQTPSKLLFGVDQRGREIDALSEYLDDLHYSDSDHNLDTLRQDADLRISGYQNRSSENYSVKHKPHIEFSVDDYVMIRNVDTTIGTNKKFIPKYKGPYRIHRVLPNDRYVIRDIEGCQLTQLPYDGVVESSRIRKWLEAR